MLIKQYQNSEQRTNHTISVPSRVMGHTPIKARHSVSGDLEKFSSLNFVMQRALQATKWPLGALEISKTFWEGAGGMWVC